MSEPSDDIVIDVHAHAVFESTYGAAGRHGPESGERDDGTPFFRIGEYIRAPMRYEGSLFCDVDRRLRAMDRIGIDRQLLSPNPLTFFGGIEPEPATAFARAANDAMAELVAAHPDRLMGSAALPLQDPRAACDELERAVGELGLIAAYVGTDYPGGLDSGGLDDVYRALVACDVPLFVHATTNDGAHPPPDARLGRFGLDLLVGYAYEETLAVASLVLGGVLDRHPDLDVCVSHGGGAAAYLVERFDAMATFAGGDPTFGDGLRRLWFDSNVGSGAARDLLVDVVGADRVVYGTNFGGWDTPGTATSFDATLTPNAHRLLRLAPSGGAGKDSP